MDEGPPPMKNMKPSQKHQTAADHFFEDHQADYESRGKATDRMRQVVLHNTAFPKLRDELDKRRSMTKAEVNVNQKKRDNTNKDCYESKRRKTHDRTNRHIEKNSRISKHKERRRVIGISCKTTQTKHFQKSVHTGMSTLEAEMTPNCSPKINGIESPTHDANRPGKKTSKHSNKSKSEVRCTTTSEKPSVSSYNSFLSMDHEPMV